MVSNNLPAKRAQPIRYSNATCDEIVERISEGEPLRAICRDEKMPAWQTVYKWMESDEDFKRRIAHAREIGYDAIAQETIEIADNSSNDWMEVNAPDNRGYKFNGDHVQRAKLRIETRLKLLSKWDPKRYGDKLQTEVTGKVATVSVNADLTPEEAFEAYKELLG